MADTEDTADVEARNQSARRDAMRIARFASDPAAPFDGRYDVPLSAGGAVARLAVADLDSDEGAAHFLRAMRWSDGSTPPTREQLRIAQRILCSVERAIAIGNAPEIWELVTRGLNAMGSVENDRRAVIELLEAGIGAYGRAGPPSVDDNDSDRAHFVAMTIREVRRALVGIDARFARVTADQFRKTVRRSKTLGGLGLAAYLSLACGAFGDERRKHESELVAFKRVKGHFESAKLSAKVLPG